MLRFSFPLTPLIFWLSLSVMFGTMMRISPQSEPSIPHIEDGCSIRGLVQNLATGEPLRDVSTQLVNAARMPSAVGSPIFSLLGVSAQASTPDYQVNSQPDGHFCFVKVKPGQYALQASKAGFLDSSYLQDGNLVLVSDSNGNTSEITVNLAPLSGIVGTILDSDDDYLADINVVAVKRAWSLGREIFMPVQGAQSNEHGDFRIGKLTPGTYYLYAQPLPRSVTSDPQRQASFVRTYYEAATSMREAVPVTVNPGEDLKGIVIHAQTAPTFHVRGKVIASRDEWLGGLVQLREFGEEPMAIVSGASNLAADGSYDFPGVPPGSYTLSFRSTYGAARRLVEVRSSDVEADVEVIGKGSIQGKVVVEDTLSGETANLTVRKITFSSVDTVVAPSYIAQVDQGGKFSQNQVYPGKYFVSVSLSDGHFIQSLKVGAKEIGDGQIDLTGGGTVNMMVVIGAGASTISGIITDGSSSDKAANKSASPFRVMLIPKRNQLDGSGMYFGATDDQDRFVIQGVAPGRYRVIAVQSIENELLQNPLLLNKVAGLGTDIAIEKNEKKSVKLQLTPKTSLDFITNRKQAQ